MVARLSSFVNESYLSQNLNGTVFGSKESRLDINNQIAECRSNLQRLTNDNLAVLNQYDVFVANLQAAFKNENGTHDKDIIKVIKAIEFAAEKHRFQTRKGATVLPYIIHPIGVADHLVAIGNIRDFDIIIAGLLHDTVEDTDTSYSEINEQFGLNVENFIRELSDDKSLPKQERKRLQIVNAPHKSEEATAVCLSDKLNNLTDLMQSPPSDWGKERLDEYVNWAKSVSDALPLAHTPLKEAVDAQIRAYWNQNSK